MFAGAKSSYEESKFVILGVPFDKTSSFRVGSYQGPDAIRNASFCFEPYMMEYGLSLSDIGIHDKGNLQDYENVKDLGKDLEQAISKILDDGKVPIVLGGEHSISYFTVSGFKNKFEKIDVIVLDAHLDYRDEYEGNKYSHATPVRRISELDFVENLVVGGVRSMSKEESQCDDISYITADNFDSVELSNIFDENNPIYLSIDMDLLDPSYAPGVGNPEPFGVEPRKIKKLIKRLSHLIVGMDIVETNPKFDVGEITSNLAARFVYELLGAKQSKKNKKWY